MKKSKNVPQIRFEGFTEDWEQRKLGELVNGFSYGLNAAAISYNGEDKYIRITDIDDISHKFLEHNLTSPDVNIDESQGYKLKKGDIVFARTGASVGKTYIYDEKDGNLYYAGFLIKASVKDDNSAEFIFQNTLTATYKKFVLITSQRSGQPGINSKEYAEYYIYIPNFKEQTLIANLLKTLDDTITLHRRKREKLLDIKNSMLYKLFPKEGNNKPEIRFQGFTDDWSRKKLGDCFSERIESFPEGELLSVTINGGVKKFSELNRNDNSNENKSKYKKVYVGDIVYNSMRMWQGASGYSPYEGIVSPAYTVLSPNNGIDSKCFSYLFKRPDIIHMFQLYSKGITSDNWNLKYPEFKELEIYVPEDYEEQRLIGQYLFKLDSLIELNSEKLDKLKQIKRFLLDKMIV